MTETDIGVYLPVASDALVYIEALMSKSFGLGIDVPSLYLDESEAMIGRPRNVSLGIPAYNEDIAVPRLLARNRAPIASSEGAITVVLYNVWGCSMPNP